MATNLDLISLDDLLRYTDENQSWLRERLKVLRKTGVRGADGTDDPLSVKALVFKKPNLDQHGITESTFDHFMRGNQKLGKNAYEILVRYLWENDWCTDRFMKIGFAKEPQALFHALAVFLDLDTQRITAMAQELPGRYVLWRPSMHIPGEFVRGMLDVERKEDSYALEAVETQGFKGEEEGAMAHTEVFEGFILRKSQYYVMIARQREQHAGPPRITVIHNVLTRDGLIQAMQGMVIGCYGTNELFAAPVFLERASGKVAEELPNTIAITAKIPRAVKPKMHMNLQDGVIRF